MKISIIIPLYNVAQYISACLDSVANQTWNKGEIECIIVDDCGQDNSAAIVERFIAEYQGNINFLLIRHNKNYGASSARNTGILAASGDYLFFLDSDDVLFPDCLQKLATPVYYYDYDFVFANHEVVCAWSDMNLDLSIPEGSILDRETIINTFRNGWFSVVWNKLVKKELIINNNLFFQIGIVREDELWNYELACVANSMYVLNERTYKYYIRSESVMSDSKSKRHLDSLVKVIEKQVRLVKKYELTENANLYRVTEDLKVESLKYAHHLLPFRQAYDLYKFFYNLNYFKNKNNTFSKIQRLRDFQYRLPKICAYFWIMFLNTCSEHLVHFRHKKELSKRKTNAL